MEHTEGSGVPVLAVDGNGVIPMDEIDGPQYAARTIRPRIHRRDPGAGVTSGLSPYLHFGCVGAREAALRSLGAGDAPAESVDAFLEQLVVRRELAFNFCRHSEHHESLEALPDWARQTLEERRVEERDPAVLRGEG